CVRWSDYW
nr:immunoglobulin heavy chain junction region [Mus musculus]NSM05497.1 immunoglobulin heavy chain junction region [Mus musculus]NSM06810.1 immunoglobulin heavy chain junction region [Mus musculus]NSM07280.1 immunoglobulin heavy chain junction region [Mus musculus]NSM08019.1 immunoglobulin heavy chain junction region [Mus musculus]